MRLASNSQYLDTQSINWKRPSRQTTQNALSLYHLVVGLKSNEVVFLAIKTTGVDGKSDPVLVTYELKRVKSSGIFTLLADTILKLIGVDIK